MAKGIDFNFWLLMLLLPFGAYANTYSCVDTEIIPSAHASEMLSKGRRQNAQKINKTINNTFNYVPFHCFVAKQIVQPHCLFGSAGFFLCSVIFAFALSFLSIPMNFIINSARSAILLLARINIYRFFFKEKNIFFVSIFLVCYVPHISVSSFFRFAIIVAAAIIACLK